MGKRDYYSRSVVAETYDAMRFGGKSGKYVDNREIEIVKNLVGKTGLLLDVATGTGRFAIALKDSCDIIVASDYSKEMLIQAKKKCVLPYVRADAFKLPFSDDTFDTAITIRFLLHYEDFRNILRELIRVTKPGGYVIFDTYSWSPQTAPIIARTFDGRVYIHRESDIMDFAEKENLELVEKTSAFLFSPTLYRYIPFPVVRMLDALERSISPSMKVRTFWKFRVKKQQEH